MKRKKALLNPGRIASAAGFSLVEMTIAMVIVLIAAAGIYSVFISQRNQTASQRLYNELQNDMTFAMDYMKNELILAGYRTTSRPGGEPNTPIHVACTDAVSFEYWDDNIAASAPLDQHVKVTYGISGTELRRTVQRYDTVAGVYLTAQPSDTRVLVDNVTALNFTYRKGDNSAFGAGDMTGSCITGSMPGGLSGAPIEKIQIVQIDLNGRSRRPDPVLRDPATGGDYYRTMALRGQVKARNLHIAAAPLDVTPPAVPTGLEARDAAQCDDQVGAGTASIVLRWNKNTDPDLAGYTIYYGTSAGAYSGRVRLGREKGASGEQELYLLGNLVQNQMYYVTISSFDRSGNMSALAAPVSGNPDPSETDFAVGTDDTTPDPSPPPPPSDFEATVPPGVDYTVNLSWGPPVNPDGSAAPGIVGYRLYRGNTATFTPMGEAAGSGNCIADETTLDGSAVSYTDEELTCETYYYKIASIACDPTLFASYTDSEFALSYGDGPGPYADVPSATASNSTPTDSESPPSPVIAARPGYKRIILTLTNPTVDFSYTEIWFSKSGYPTMDAATGAISGGSMIPNHNGPEQGRFYNISGQSVWSINFKHETSDDPLVEPNLDIGTVDNPTTYYFLAVAYDDCGNHSELTAFSIVEALQCGDCDTGELCYGAPPMDTVKSEGCGVSGAPYVVFDTVGPGITLSWPFASETTYRDLAGYRIYRQVYTAGLNALGPGQAGSSWSESDNLVDPYSDALWLDTFPDTSVQEGVAYSYLVCASDCYWERYKDDASPPADAADNIACRLASTSPVYVGGLDQQDRPFILQTELDGILLTGTTTVTVLSTADFPEAGEIEITSVSGREVISYDGVTATTFENLTRDILATGEFNHGSGSQVTVFPFPPPVEARSGYDIIDPLMGPFEHNVATYWVDSTAAGPLNLRELKFAWTNTEAYLRWIDIGDGSTTPRTGPPNYDYFSAPPFTYGWFIDPTDGSPVFNGQVSLPTVKEIDGLDDLVPVRFGTLTLDGTGRPDKRESVLSVEMVYENPSTVPPTTCLSTQETVAVPLGPVVRSVSQNNPEPVTISWPVPGDSGTNVMDNVIANGGLDVDITAVVQDTSFSGMFAVLLFYYIDSGAVLSSPPDFTPVSYESLDDFEVSLLPAGWSFTPLCNVAGPEYRTRVPDGTGGEATCTHPVFGDSSPIPASDGDNVWYFVMAQDLTGNFDRSPEQGSGMYQYFQKEASACETVPSPATISGTATATAVTLTIDVPAVNSVPSGSPLEDMAGYWVYRDWGYGSILLEEVAATSPGTLTYTDTYTQSTTSLSAGISATATAIPVSDPTVFLTPATITIGSENIFCATKTETAFEGCSRGHDGTAAVLHSAGEAVSQDLLLTEENSYTVKVVDTCSPDPNLSSPSNVFTECIGAAPCALRLNPQGGGDFLFPGSTFGIDLTVCSKQGGFLGPTPGETVYVQVCADATGDADPVELIERLDTGQFRVNSGAYNHGGDAFVTTYAAADYDALSSTTRTDLKVGDIDTIRVTAYREPCDPFLDPTCSADPAPYPDNFGSCVAPDPMACDEAELLVLEDPCTALPQPGAPTDLSAVGPCTDNPPKEVNLGWTAPAQGPVSYYEIQVCQEDNKGNCPWDVLPERPAGTSFTTQAPASISGKIIRYRVLAVNALCPTNPVKTESLPEQAVCAP